MAKKKTLTDWEKLAWEAFWQLEMATTRLRATSDWFGSLRNKDTGECYTWEESFIRTMEKFPGVQVDRRYTEAKYLPAKERRKEFARLNAEHKESEKTS